MEIAPSVPLPLIKSVNVGVSTTPTPSSPASISMLSSPLPPSLADEEDSSELPPFYSHHKHSQSLDDANIGPSRHIIPPGSLLNHEPVVGISSNAILQRQMRSSVLLGTWKLNQLKWDRFSEKVLEQDPKATLDPQRPLHAFHSHCKNWVAIDLPYDFHSFEHH